MTSPYKRYGAPRRKPRRGWFGVIATLLGAAALLLVLFALGRLLIGMLGGTSSTGGGDPMFAPTPEAVTRPPELSGEGEAVIDPDEDPSRNWHYDTLTPLTPDGYAAES